MNTNILNAIILLLKVLTEDPCKPAEVKPGVRSVTLYRDANELLWITNRIAEPLPADESGSGHVVMDATPTIPFAAGPWHETAKDGEPKEDGWYLVQLDNKAMLIVIVPMLTNTPVSVTGHITHYAKIRMPQ